MWVMLKLGAALRNAVVQGVSATVPGESKVTTSTNVQRSAKRKQHFLINDCEAKRRLLTEPCTQPLKYFTVAVECRKFLRKSDDLSKGLDSDTLLSR